MTIGIQENLEKVRSRIQQACDLAGRSSEEVSLVAVSKKKSVQDIREALEVGLLVFGENRVQEARLKVHELPPHLQWHMIGHLQSNKARDAVRFFHMIESLDSFALAMELEKSCEAFSKTIAVLLQVNVSGEASKHGFSPESIKDEIKTLNDLARLEIHGFMTMAPWTPEPEKVRPCFRRLREVRDTCEDVMGVPFPILSMGMSGDFEIAIQEGATHIRIGTALFGPR